MKQLPDSNDNNQSTCIFIILLMAILKELGFCNCYYNPYPGKQNCNLL
jgi:hypothetical protein